MSSLELNAFLQTVTITGAFGWTCRAECRLVRGMQVVKRHFRPEFLNRLDDVVIFEPLGTDHLRKIARLQARFIWTLRF